MKVMAELTGFLSLCFFGLMILIEVLGLGAQRTPFPAYAAILCALWSIGWTVREVMEKKQVP